MAKRKYRDRPTFKTESAAKRHRAISCGKGATIRKTKKGYSVYPRY